MIPWLLARDDDGSAAIATKLAARGADVRVFGDDDVGAIVEALAGKPCGAVFFTPRSVDVVAATGAQPFAVCINKAAMAAVARTQLAKQSVLVPHTADIVEFVCSLQEKK